VTTNVSNTKDNHMTKNELIAQIDALKAEMEATKAAMATMTTPKVRTGKKAPKECACGNMTKGGTWMPGHDAVHAAKANGTYGKNSPKSCYCKCGGMTKGGTFLPGHDAIYYSNMRKAEGLTVN
jgi:hypothetical protein